MRVLIASLMCAAVVALGLTAGPVQAATTNAAHPVTTQHSSVGRPPHTVVTFAWGGGLAGQMPAVSIMRQYGMHGTYFVPSGLVCTSTASRCAKTSPYLTLSDVHKIAANGNEIGGLSVLHQKLTKLSTAEVKREVCNDRVNLRRWGTPATDFAYPFATATPALQGVIRQCGYNAGLGAGQLRGAGRCPTCAYAESIPPRDPLLVRAPIEVNSLGTVWTPRTFESVVQGAQRHGGGWVVFLIHNVCPKTCAYGVTSPVLRTFLAWLQGAQQRGVAVETMRQVIGGRIRPAVPGPVAKAIPPPGVANAQLAQTTPGGLPSCFQRADYGSNSASFAYLPAGGPGASSAEQLRVTNWQSGEAKLLQSMDLGQCAPQVKSGASYTVGTTYKSNVPARIEVYYRTAVGNWVYWATSPPMPATTSWSKASWTTPAVPAGATGMSFGLAATSNATIITTAYTMAPAKSHRSEILLGILAVVLIGGALIARGQYRYIKHTRAEEAAAQRDQVRTG
ncbi:MAG TPA: polysaccharide deacetylase family protein [Streptosporangiaceae bacterium]|jgi:peptidoglycan/xylan/chitin deacetylase (PgdA/CDA1 family)|nr:polysaccharide deacetylase family protein [Streptosporangiaceae bacterium]